MKKLLFACSLLIASLASADTAFQNFVTQTTWAAKPTCNASTANITIRVTDLGGYDGTNYAGSFWVCDSSVWKPVNGRVLLYSLPSPVTRTGAGVIDVETAIGATVLVPAGSMGATGAIRVEFLTSAITNNANAKNVRFRWGSSSTCTSNSTSITTNNQASLTEVQGTHVITNNGATNSQVILNSAVTAPFSGNTNAVTTTSIDTASDAYFCVTVQDATTTDSHTTNWWKLWLEK